MLSVRQKSISLFFGCLLMSASLWAQETQSESDSTKVKKKFQLFKKKKIKAVDSVSLSGNITADISIIPADSVRSLSKKELRQLNYKLAIRQKLKPFQSSASFGYLARIRANL